MKSGLLVVAFTVVLSGCVESKRDGPATRNSGITSAVVSNSATNDLSATNKSKNGESEDVIKPKDTLLVTFANLPGSIPPPFDQQVKDDDTITLIYKHLFQAAGKRIGDLEKEIRDYYVPEYFRDLRVMVRLSSGSFVYVDGGFRNPGRYPWTNGMRLKDAIDAAGGFNEFATPSVTLIRLDGTREKFRLRGEWMRTNNPALRPGDKIHNRRDFL